MWAFKESYLKSGLFLILCLTAELSLAGSYSTYERSGAVDTSVNATNQKGFDCARSVGKSYFLTKLPICFSTEFGKAGLLKDEHVGQYKLVIVIDKNSQNTVYQVDPSTDEKSMLVQTVINLD